jgi:hypothetical protein
MLPILNDIYRLYSNSVTSQTSDGTAIGPTQNIGGDSQSHSSGRSRAVRSSRSRPSTSGAAVRVDISSNGRDIQDRLYKARDLRTGWEDTYSALSDYAESIESQESLMTQGQSATVIKPIHLAGLSVRVIKHIPGPGGMGPGVVICVDENGVTMAFDPAELQLLG